MSIAKHRQKLKRAFDAHKDFVKIKEANKQPKNKNRASFLEKTESKPTP